MFFIKDNTFTWKQQSILLGLIPDDCDDDVRELEAQIVVQNVINSDVLNMPENKRNAVMEFYKKAIEFSNTAL